MLGHVIHKVNKVIHSQDFLFNSDWENALSKKTEIEILVEVKEQLTNICAVKTKDLIRKIQFVLDVDEKMYRKVQTLTHNYLKSLNNNYRLKDEVEKAVYEYLRQLYTTYTHTIVEYQRQNQAILNSEKINLLLARYLNAAFMMAKWRYFDDQPAPLGLWSNVHKVIKAAEELTMLNKDLFLYDFQNEETSLATILKRGFMLNTLQKGSYTQFQIELTDRVLKIWASNPKISNQYTTQDEYQFFIHLDGDKGPQRIRGAKHHPDFRYWRTARIVDLIEAYLCAVDTRKPLNQFKLNKTAKTEDVVELFKKLRVEWCVKGYKRQRRKNERVPKFNMLNVSYGVDQIGARIRYLQHQRSNAKQAIENVNLALVADAVNAKVHFKSERGNAYGRENWAMLEESEHGFSVELGRDISAWVKSGVLIGYSTIDGGNKISLAEIKTVRQRANGTYRVGLAKLSSNAVVLKVSKGKKSRSPEAITGYVVEDGEEKLSYSDVFSGLFIDDDKVDKPRLIVPRHQYKRACRYKVEMNGQEHAVLAGQVVNSHREWVCFDVIV